MGDWPCETYPDTIHRSNIPHDDLQPCAGIETYFRWDLERLEARELRGEQVFKFEWVHAYGQLQDHEATLAVLHECVDERSYPAQWIARDVWLGFLHGDPEYESMLQELGLPSPSES